MSDLHYNSDDELFRIREVSEMFDISIDTLRYYDKIGLIPSSRNKENNYRTFDLQAMTCIYTVKLLRSVGVPTEQIRTWFSEPTLPVLSHILEETHVQTQNNIRELLDQQENFFFFYSRLSHIENHPDHILLRHSPDLWYWYQDEACSYASLQRAMTEAQNESGMLPLSAFFISKDLFSGDDLNYTKYAVVFTKPPAGVSRTADIKSSLCAYSVFIGNQFEDLSRKYDEVTEWMRAHSFTPSGDPMEIYVAGTHDCDIIELWVPIEEN